MKNKLLLFVIVILFVRCMDKPASTSKTIPEIEGTWKLISAQNIVGNDTTNVNYSKDMSAIKIINKNHFAFFQHDLNKGRDSGKAKFSSGAGRYKLQENQYTEFLEYCSAREWEDNIFNFTVHITNDSLIQTGVEKLSELGIDRKIIETYVRANKVNTSIPVNNKER